jgi:hypothetical protein
MESYLAEETGGPNVYYLTGVKQNMRDRSGTNGRPLRDQSGSIKKGAKTGVMMASGEYRR